MKFEEMLLKRYLGNKEFFFRVRNEKGRNKLSVYYNGIKYFSYENGKFKLNKAVFILNTKNIKKVSSYTIPELVNKDVKIVEDLNFKFTVGSICKKYKSRGKKFDLEKIRNNCPIVEELKNQIKDIYPNVSVEEDNDNKNKYYFFIGKNEDGIIKFNVLYKLLFIGYKKCSSIKFNVDLINDDITNLINNFESSFDQLDEVIKRRINIYCSEKEENEGDYNRTKTDNNTEKQYQQKLMEIVSSNNKSESMELDKKIFKNKKVIPFEMEYNMYSEEKENIKRSTPKGRIDNLFIKNDTLVMVELKMGTPVIGGTNGIHKHLLDLCTILKNNKTILSTTSNSINERDTILNKYESTKNYVIGRKQAVDLKNLEYYIICGYDETKGVTKKEVKEEIDRLYDKTIKSIDLFKTNDKSAITEDSKTIKDFHKSLEKYDDNLLNLTVSQYIQILNDRYDCPVEIYLANEDYTSIEKY